MSIELKLSKKKYSYKYIQFTATSAEKKQIKQFATEENFKTTSEFVRRIVFDYIRRQENPELFHSKDSISIDPLQMEWLAKNIRKIIKYQEILLQREGSIEKIKEIVMNIYSVAELKPLAKERETIIQLLENYDSLSLQQIQEKSKLVESVIFKVLSDMNLFKITSTGRFALRCPK